MIRKFLALAATPALAAGIVALAGPAGASPGHAARPASSSLHLVLTGPVLTQHPGGVISPLIGNIFFELKNDFTECLVGQGANNPVKTSTTTCSTFNIQYPPPDDCGPGTAVVYRSAANNYALRAENGSQIVELSNEADASEDTNAVWDGTTNVPLNCKFGGLATLVAANDAPNSSVYARNHAGDWRFIENST